MNFSHELYKCGICRKFRTGKKILDKCTIALTHKMIVHIAHQIMVQICNVLQYTHFIG